jgi:hypothetical protein
MASNSSAEVIASPADTIHKLQEELRKFPQLPELPTLHHFADGLYSRTCEISPGGLVISKTHRKECLFIVLAGLLHVSTDSGVKAALYPASIFKAPAGKRAVFADPKYGPALITTVHRLDPYTEDLEEIERQLVVPEEGDNYDFSNKLKDPALAFTPAPMLENN